MVTMYLFTYLFWFSKPPKIPGKPASLTLKNKSLGICGNLRRPLLSVTVKVQFFNVWAWLIKANLCHLQASKKRYSFIFLSFMNSKKHVGHFEIWAMPQWQHIFQTDQQFVCCATAIFSLVLSRQVFLEIVALKNQTCHRGLQRLPVP